jgi:hypothetical protein
MPHILECYFSQMTAHKVLKSMCAFKYVLVFFFSTGLAVPFALLTYDNLYLFWDVRGKYRVFILKRNETL